MADATHAPENAPMTAQSTLMASWRSWALCVAAPGAWLGYVLYKLPSPGSAGEGAQGLQNAADGVSGAVSAGSTGGWLIVAGVVWLALMGPAIFILRSYCFRAAWDGRPVEPESYLKGMASIWAVLVVGAVLALLGAILAGQWLPGVAVAGLAIGGVVLARPSGKAMGLGTAG